MSSLRNRHNIIISNEQEIIHVPVHTKLLIKRAINVTLEYVGFDKKTEVSVTLVDDERIQELNKEYRNKDASTDVLSFPLDEEDMLGDIVISVEHAIRQAYDYMHSVDREIAFLTVHSMLHLLGWDHERSDEEEQDMFDLQEQIMNVLGLKRRK